MTTLATALADAERQELAAKKKCVQIEHVPASQLPYRVFKRSTGVCLHSCTTPGAVDIFLQSVPLAQLQSKPTSRRKTR